MILAGSRNMCKSPPKARSLGERITLKAVVTLTSQSQHPVLSGALPFKWGIALELLLSRGIENCLVSCDCSVYLKRAWCKHACGIAMHRGIVTGYPLLKDPRPVIGDTGVAGGPRRRTHPLTIDP